MKIDFTMSGMNFLLFLGLILILMGVCLLALQNRIKRWKHFVVRDFIYFSVFIGFIIGGIVAFVFGLISAIPFMVF